MTLAGSSRRPWWECHQKDVYWSHEDSPYVCHEKPHGQIWQPDKSTIKRQPNRSWALDLADLLKKFQTDHIPMKDGNVLKKIVVHGDQLMEQACNAQWTYKLGGNRSRMSWRVGVHIFWVPPLNVHAWGTVVKGSIFNYCKNKIFSYWYCLAFPESKTGWITKEKHTQEMIQCVIPPSLNLNH